MNQKVTNIRKAVCAMANQLRKTGYSLSGAFRKAWRRVKQSMTVRAAGVTFENRQERLRFLQQFKPEHLAVALEREPDNRCDRNAINITVYILPLKKKTVIGYVPAGLARELAKAIDAGVKVKAKLLQIIGGYSYKENLGALINIAV